VLSQPRVPAIKSILPGDQWPPGRMLGMPTTQVELISRLAVADGVAGFPWVASLPRAEGGLRAACPTYLG